MFLSVEFYSGRWAIIDAKIENLCKCKRDLHLMRFSRSVEIAEARSDPFHFFSRIYRVYTLAVRYFHPKKYSLAILLVLLSLLLIIIVLGSKGGGGFFWGLQFFHFF